MERYAAKLLFQYRRNDVEGARLSRRVCEERIIHFWANDNDDAMNKANSYGRENELHDTAMGRDVLLEFVGIIEIDSIIVDYGEEPMEVWWEFRERVLPMERRERFVPPKSKLRLFRDISTPDRRMKV